MLATWPSIILFIERSTLYRSLDRFLQSNKLIYLNFNMLYFTSTKHVFHIYSYIHLQCLSIKWCYETVFFYIKLLIKTATMSALLKWHALSYCCSLSTYGFKNFIVHFFSHPPINVSTNSIIYPSLIHKSTYFT